MFTTLFAAILFVTVGSAQAHPCDEALPLNPSLKAPVIAGFCHDEPNVSVRVLIDGAVVWIGNPAKVTASPNAEGLYYFETPNLSVKQGTHFAQVDISNGTMPMEPAYQFTIVSKGQAQKVRVKGGGL